MSVRPPLAAACLLFFACASAAGPLADLEKDVITLVERVSPSVVSVRVLSAPGARERQGTGFVWDAGGYIATTTDVVQGARRLRVILSDRREVTAEVVGEDVFSNLALLRIPEEKDDTRKLRPVKVGDSLKLRVGSWALTVGNLVGLDHTISLGMVSGLDRTVTSGARNFTSLFQIAGALGPGASGAPVFDASGAIIGVTAASVGYPGGPAASFRAEDQSVYNDLAPLPGRTPGRASMGSGGLSDVRILPGILDTAGLAIPIHVARPILDELKKHGRVLRPWLGVFLLMPDKGSEKQWPADTKGVVVHRIARDGPAFKAGLRPGDVILTVDGRPTIQKDFAGIRLADSKAGDVLVMEVQRGAERRRVRLTLEPRPTKPPTWLVAPSTPAPRPSP